VPFTLLPRVGAGPASVDQSSARLLLWACCHYREQPPRAGYAFQCVVPSVLETKAGARDEVLHGARCEHLTGVSERSNP
jgi:hypothetical protein